MLTLCRPLCSFCCCAISVVILIFFFLFFVHHTCINKFKSPLFFSFMHFIIQDNISDKPCHLLSHDKLTVRTVFLQTPSNYSRTSLIRSLSYDFLVPMFTIENTKKWHNTVTLLFYVLICSWKAQSFTTNVQHITKLRLYDTLHPMWTRKGMRHARSRAVDTSHSSFPTVLAGPCCIKMPPCTQLPLPIPANLFTGCCTSHSQLYIIAISTFTYLFESACGVVLLKAFCMLLKGNTSIASPYPAAGGIKWASCFALPALYFGGAH